MGVHAGVRPSLRAQETRVRIHSSWVLACEVAVMLLVFFGCYEFSSGEADSACVFE